MSPQWTTSGFGEAVPAGDGELRETRTPLRNDGYAGYASLEPYLELRHTLGGFCRPAHSGRPARALTALPDSIGVRTA